MIHWLVQYVLLAAGLAASLTLFFSVKREMHTHASKNRRRIDELLERLNDAHARESDPQPMPAPAPPRSGLNLNKRVQAMRMLRRNEDISHVAAALGVTRKEVELLIRVQGMSREASAGSSGQNS